MKVNEFDDSCTLYVYENISEELENKVGKKGIKKVFRYEKQFLDNSSKVLELGVKSGEEFERDMVYYIQKKTSSKLILTVENVTEILKLEEEYYIKGKEIEDCGIEGSEPF